MNEKSQGQVAGKDEIEYNRCIRCTVSVNNSTHSFVSCRYSDLE